MNMRRFLILPILVLAAALPTVAQTHGIDMSPSGISYAEGRSWWTSFFGQRAMTVAPLNETNSQRVQSLIRDGKMYISINDAVALALENNLDIAIQRFNLPIADTDIMKAKAGGTPSGVSAGVVSGTPGGGGATTGTAGATGSGAGGTSTAAGGAGAGSGGVVATSAGGGPGTPDLDPTFTSSFGEAYDSVAETSTVLTGTNQLYSHATTANFTYSQGFLPGTNLSIGFTNDRASNTGLTNLLNPVITSGLNVSVSQPLLQGCCVNLNDRNMVIAKNNREIADIAFRQQVEATVAQVEDIYWGLVTASEAVKVSQEAVDLAQRVLGETQHEVQLGTLAPLQIAQAQASLATDQQELIVNQTNYEYQELLLKNAVTKNMNDPVLAAADVIPTDDIVVPANAPIEPIDDLIRDALQYRPELAESRINLTNSQISLDATKNQLLPTANISASYNASGEAGLLIPGRSVPTLLVGGYGQTLTNVFDGNFPSYTAGFSYSIPIANHTGEAAVVRAELQLQQSQVQLLQETNNIIISVRQAQYALVQSIAQVQAAQQAVTFDAETMDADQKKLQLGAATLTDVITDQSNLTAAQSNLLNAQSTYIQNKVNLERLTGRTLVDMRISILDAENGKVTQMPQAIK